MSRDDMLGVCIFFGIINFLASVGIIIGMVETVDRLEKLEKSNPPVSVELVLPDEWNRR